jgi:hypothetical protein
LTYLENSPAGNDLVRPGEQWFCYWKTSAALWEGRILQSPADEVFFIPLHWGYHAEGSESWDFGRLHPERDLLRLTHLLIQHNRRFCWLLPLCPTPFFPNGGVPSEVARTLSVSPNGIHLGVLDQENQFNKMYSYFEPKVFQSFARFLNALAQLLIENKIKAPLWGTIFNYYEGKEIISYMVDRSLAFEQSFSRYLKQNYKEGVNLSDPKEEETLKSSFSAEVQELFKSTAETALSPFWQGTQNISVLGGSPSETIQRSLPDGRSQLNYVYDLLNHQTYDRWISTALLTKAEKGALLPKILLEHFGGREIERRYHYHLNDGEFTHEWKAFGLIDVFDNENDYFQKSGLTNFLRENFRWMYTKRKELSFTSEAIDENQHKIKFFYGATLDRTRFAQMLKLFMMGQKVVLDRKGLSAELEGRLQVFFLENNLKVQIVNFFTTVNLCELGEGRFITYDGSLLKNGSDKKFWPQFFKYFNLNHVDMNLDEDIFSLWRIRATTPAELNFLDVRRVNLYNPTSYKKRAIIHTKGSFAFMKTIDPSHASAKSISHGVEVELLPQGRIALDFGHYEEN